MAIIYQKDAGLGEAINNLGSILGGVIQQKTLQNQFNNINKKVKDKPISATLLQEILAEPGGMQYLQQFGPIIAPVLKEQARSQGAGTWLSNAFPDIFPAGGAQSGQGGQGMIPNQQPQAPQVSPVQEANLMQRGTSQAPGPVSAVAEARSAQSNVPDISGVPSRPPLADSNRVGPQEQTVYQQGGQAGMGLNPPSDGGDMMRQQQQSMAAAQPNRTPANAQPMQAAQGLSRLSDEQLVKLAGSPYKEHQNLAQAEMERRKPERQESADIRKESRAEIAKYSEPYRDLNLIDASVSKLEKAKDLIQNRKVSLDQNQFRRLTTAILEDEDYSAVAQYFKSDDQKMLFALLKDYFKTKDIGGSNPSTKEVLLSLATLPSENMGKEANVALINELLKDAKSRQIKGQTINEIRASGKQYNFGEFQKQVEDRVKQDLAPIEKQFSQDLVKAQYAKQVEGKKPNVGYVWVVDSQGQLGQIPKQNLKKFEASGGVVLDGK